jgi:ribonuclease HII
MATIKFNERFNKDHFEKIAWAQELLVCGIDEVGRGCLAGPVVTAAAILKPHKKSALLKDSKLLNEEELQKGYRWAIKNCWYAWAIVSNRDIDRHNIYHATLRTMKRNLIQLLAICPLKPSQILVDAMPVSLANTAYQDIDVVHFPFGERKSSSIAAASIIAKITRDEIMRRMHKSFPCYNFAKHKGYATSIHRDAVKQHGASLIHRQSFLGQKGWLVDQQLDLFRDLE